MLWNKFDIAEMYWDTYEESKSSVFSIMAGWIAEMFFMLFFTYIAVYPAEYCWVWSSLAYGLSNN